MKRRTGDLKNTFKNAARINGRELNDDELEQLDNSTGDDEDEKQRLGDIRDLFASRKIAYQTLASWYAW